MVCFSPVGFDVLLTFRALALRQNRLLSRVWSLLRQRANARNVSYTSNPTGEKHTISTRRSLLLNISMSQNGDSKCKGQVTVSSHATYQLV